MNITRQVIADAGMISKAKVSKDCERGVLKEANFLSIVSYVLANRMLSGGIQAVTGLCPEGRVSEELNLKPSKQFLPDRIEPTFIPTHHDYASSDDVYVNPND